MGSETQSAASESCEKNAVVSASFRADFRQHITDAVVSKKRCDSQSVRLFSQDETRYGLLPVINRRITLRGIKPVAEIDARYESIYLYGAVEPLTGERFFLEFSHITSECFQCFIEKFSEAFSESLNVLVLDNGRFHQAKSLEIPENIVFVFLPPYSRELNPIERLWQDIKAKLFVETYKTLGAMQAKVIEILGDYSDTAIAKLTSFSHFINAANAI
ncbi:MAG: IS630 family transposase [Candidatus Poribacteria bacterium]|nr:IS630 family transposase [Candidatus Poribacteria bacterium]